MYIPNTQLEKQEQIVSLQKAITTNLYQLPGNPWAYVGLELRLVQARAHLHFMLTHVMIVD